MPASGRCIGAWVLGWHCLASPRASANSAFIPMHLCTFVPPGSAPGQFFLVVAYGCTVQVWSDVRRRGRVLRASYDAVSAIAVSPDGRRLATGSWDERVRIWDTQTWELAHILRGHGDWVMAVAWSPDGMWFASGTIGNTVRIWDTRSWACVKILGTSGTALSLAWSPDGAQFALAANNTVCIWDATTWHLVRVLEGHGKSVRAIAWSPTLGRALLASASEDNAVRIWDACTGLGVRILTEHRGCVGSIAWSPDGQRLASSVDHTGLHAVRIWDTRTWERVQILGGRSIGAESVTWSPDGTRLFSGTNGGMVRIWDTDSWGAVQALRVKADSPEGPETGASAEDLAEPSGALPAPASRPHPVPLARHSVLPFVRALLLARPEYDECDICRIKMDREKQEEIFITLCGHWFHRACLQSWYEARGHQFSCPTCRCTSFVGTAGAPNQ